MSTNHYQRLVLWAGAGWVCLCLAFPPWAYVFDGPGRDAAVKIDRPAGHSPLFAPPKPPGDYWGVRVDYGRALMYAAIGAVLSAAGLLTLRPSSTPALGR